MINEIKITEKFITDNETLDESFETRKSIDIDNKKLVLKNINFNYLEKKSKTLDNVDLSIKLGQTIGIIGPSGSGNYIDKYYAWIN